MEWLDWITLLGVIAVVIAAFCYPIGGGDGGEDDE